MSSIDELASEEALNSDEILSSVLVLVWVSEDDLSEGGSTAGVMYNFLDDSLDVAILNNGISKMVGFELTLLFRRNQEF